ncbi:MAG: hypothetical protein COA84_07670 [Robiginitomaculum sp.]|nr:MAG: hypothetical protein COA84_07670 [Robiginitomaculum sp.]
MTLPLWYRFMISVRRLVESHADGGLGVKARLEMQEALVMVGDLDAAQTPDPFLFKMMCRFCGAWATRTSDSDREILSPIIFEMCEGLRRARQRKEDV